MFLGVNMAVESRPNSKYWYGRWQENGLRYSKSTKVLVRGEPGSDDYEESRQEAEQALEELRAESRKRHHPEELVQRVHEIKFGTRIGSIALKQLAAEWVALPRPRPITANRARYGRAVIGRFVAFIQSEYPRVKEVAAVTQELAEAFMAAEDKRGISGRTYNAQLSLLRGAFERLRLRAGMIANPFRGNLVHRQTDSIPRQPFSIEELERLFKAAAEKDPEIHDLVLLGACTALRLGDACCLKWIDVDLERRRIRVKTRKTGEPVTLPLFNRLEQALRARRRTGPYVFPGLATAYINARWQIRTRLQEVFTAAALRRPKQNTLTSVARAALDLDIPDEAAMRGQVMARLKAAGPELVSDRLKDTMVAVYDRYSSGESVADIARSLDISKGSVSNYIKRIETITGHPIIRREVEAIRLQQALASLPEVAPAPERRGGRGVKKVNPRGFHALRATFATTALSAGVPIEIVRMITGHTMTDTILKHYFNPQEGAMLAAVEAAMPAQLTGVGQSPEDRARVAVLDLIDNAHHGNEKAVLARLRQLFDRPADGAAAQDKGEGGRLLLRAVAVPKPI